MAAQKKVVDEHFDGCSRRSCRAIHHHHCHTGSMYNVQVVMRSCGWLPEHCENGLGNDLRDESLQDGVATRVHFLRGLSFDIKMGRRVA